MTTKNDAWVRKIDTRLLPLLILLYLFSYLDRSSIGNAKVAGMEQDLDLTPNEFNWSLSIFFLGYMIFEVPSNIVLKHLGASRFLPLIAITWALLTISLAVVKNDWQLMLVRLLLGIAESGLFPGIIFYLTLWYTKTELALRYAIFLGGATSGGAFGGLLSSAVMTLDGVLSIKGWQWIFIVEGGITILIGISAWFLLPDSPKEAWFLTDEEKLMAINRITPEKKAEDESTLRALVGVLTTPRTWMFALIAFFGAVASGSPSLFLPSILNGMGFSRILSQLLSTPPYILSLFLLFINGLYSDRNQERALHIAGPLAVATFGYLGLMFVQDVVVKYFIVCFTVATVVLYVPILMSWISASFSDSTERAIAIAVVNVLWGVGNFISGQTYRDSDKPDYRIGHFICGCMSLLGAVIALLVRFLLSKYGL